MKTRQITKDNFLSKTSFSYWHSYFICAILLAIFFLPLYSITALATTMNSTNFVNKNPRATQNHREKQQNKTQNIQSSELTALEKIPLIPRKIIFSNPEKTSPALSPDGTKIAFLAPINGVLNIWVAKAGDEHDLSKARAITHEKERDIHAYFWTFNNRYIIYMQDQKGDENYHLYRVDVTNKDNTDLTPFPKIQAQIIKASSKFPNELLIGLNNRNPEWHDVYHLNILTGKLTLVEENNQFLGYIADEDLKLRIARKSIEDGGAEIYFKAENNGNEWNLYERVPFADALTTYFLGFNKSGNIAYKIDSQNRDKAALYAYNFTSAAPANAQKLDKFPKKTLLAENKEADISDVLFNPTELTPEAYAYEYTKVNWKILDSKIDFSQTGFHGMAQIDSSSLVFPRGAPEESKRSLCGINEHCEQGRNKAGNQNAKSIAKDFSYLKQAQQKELKEEFEIVDRSLADDKWLVSYYSDTKPSRFYLYTRDAKTFAPKKLTYLFTTIKKLEQQPLVSMKPVIIKSRDGLNLVCYLSLPKEPKTAAKIKFPLVLLVHGGPWGRDSWGLSRYHQWLTNRGYAVLSVNFRGSTGFGKAFINAGNKEWARKMHDDLIDVVNWAIKNNIADAKKIAIMGGSYGGYATLVGLTFTPKTFCCGVSIVGPTNLITLLKSVPPYWKPEIALFKMRVGDVDTEEGRKLLKERSPLTYADRIQKPLLILQGEHDPRVPKAEADQIVKSMKAKNIPVTYILYHDEGHGFVREPNQISANAIIEQFLAKNLGGRAEPINPAEDFKGANFSVEPHDFEMIFR